MKQYKQEGAPGHRDLHHHRHHHRHHHHRCRHHHHHRGHGRRHRVTVSKPRETIKMWDDECGECWGISELF
jgi:hypothetical protein